MILTIIGIDKQVSVCECCGKKDLAKTVILAERDSVNAKPKRFLRYGVICAKAATDFKGPDIVKRAKQFERFTDTIRRHHGPEATPAIFGHNGI